MNQLTPRQIVAELDKYIIGQDEAKRAVAIALRNRYRRSRLEPEVREEITPKNILMVGPTGVGKTEIARRLAKLVDAPLVKVEATKFTEVGYVGRDVDSMVRDLVETSLRQVKERMGKDVELTAEQNAQERILDALVSKEKGEKKANVNPIEALLGPVRKEEDPPEVRQSKKQQRELRKIEHNTPCAERIEQLFPERVHMRALQREARMRQERIPPRADEQRGEQRRGDPTL